MSARATNIVLGIWLFISAFLWRHSPQQMTNTWICGVLIVLFALVSLRVPQARYVNTVLSIWLFISAFALPTAEVGTIWNNAIVAVVVFFTSLVRSETEGYLSRRTPAQPV